MELLIVRTPNIVEGQEDSMKTLSIYITSLMVDFAQHDFEMGASMMAAIKCQDDRVGERGARAEWVWEFWQNDWIFRQGSEVWGGSLFCYTMTCCKFHTHFRMSPSSVIDIAGKPSNPGNGFFCHLRSDSLSHRTLLSTTTSGLLCSA
jgi:hypothetical protein